MVDSTIPSINALMPHPLPWVTRVCLVAQPLPLLQLIPLLSTLVLLDVLVEVVVNLSLIRPLILFLTLSYKT